ncbi:helix-turn-helix transcriptional regulator [Intrasporangium sp.]|uniref:heat shock protein transcriptional repressor HspR n=1 Tax=Intrasporangium sp. TaxID=1925024 RepID=UPI00322195C0
MARQSVGLGAGPGDDTPVFVISVAAQLAGMHAQTLRQYDRMGIVTPSRTRGGGRRYSSRDVELLREVQRLSHEGVSLAGIQRILELEQQVEALRSHVQQLAEQLESAQAAAMQVGRVFAAGARGDVVAMAPGRRPPRPVHSQALVVWRPDRRRASS